MKPNTNVFAFSWLIGFVPSSTTGLLFIHITIFSSCFIFSICESNNMMHTLKCCNILGLRGWQCRYWLFLWKLGECHVSHKKNIVCRALLLINVSVPITSRVLAESIIISLRVKQLKWYCSSHLSQNSFQRLPVISTLNIKFGLMFVKYCRLPIRLRCFFFLLNVLNRLFQSRPNMRIY